MKLLHAFLGIVCAFAMMLALLVTSVEAVCYWTPGYYEKEYEKYGVLDDVQMEMDDLLYVTQEMMAYLRGNREDLHIPTVVAGQPREFFNDREIAHMEDVRGLFLGGLLLRRVCLVVIAACLLLLKLTRARIRESLPGYLCAGTCLFFAFFAAIALIIASNFSKYFIIFHLIFFDNDLWMLDPNTDLLINIVPEPFFADTALRIGLTYAGSVCAVLAVCIFLIFRRKKKRSGKAPALLLALALMMPVCTLSARADDVWPDDVSIEAEGGIVIDAGSGAVLYGKNIHEPYYPASITKILTALIVIENCSLDEMVTFSYNAVYNVESGSSNAGLDEGDVLSVRDCLYALLLKSANEAANALAEHISGSNEEFAVLMNEKAASLGCADSHFNNPSGLNDENHYTSAYDMALIAQAAFRNEIFVAIDSTLYYDLPATRRNPEGLRIYPGHQMMKKNLARYYPGIIGGKTGYTSLAGNTLVTCAQRDGMKLISVVLNGHNTHYTDTKALLDFGFANFRSESAAELDTDYRLLEGDLTICDLTAGDLSILKLSESGRITLPAAAGFAEVTSRLTYSLPASAPPNAAAQVVYEYDGRQVGVAYLINTLLEPEAALLTPEAEAAALETLSQPETEPEEDTAAETGTAGAQTSPTRPGSDTAGTVTGSAGGYPSDNADGSRQPVTEREASGTEGSGFSLPAFMRVPLLFLCILAAIVLLLSLRARAARREQARRTALNEQRNRRLHEIGMSSDEFQSFVQQNRSGSALRSSGQNRRRPKKHKSFLDEKRPRR